MSFTVSVSKTAAQQAFDVAKANLKFATSTKTQKRVIIAKDVLKWLDQNRITAERMTYVGDEKCTPGGKLQSCTACALGAVFVTAFDRSPDLWDQVSGFNADDMRKYLSPYFSEGQLRLIESAFEMSDFSERDCDLTFRKDSDGEFIENDDGTFVTQKTTWGRAVDLGRRYDYNDDRLRAIMTNIIRNKGTFKP